MPKEPPSAIINEEVLQQNMLVVLKNLSPGQIQAHLSPEQKEGLVQSIKKEETPAKSPLVEIKKPTFEDSPRDTLRLESVDQESPLLKFSNSKTVQIGDEKRQTFGIMKSTANPETFK